MIYIVTALKPEAQAFVERYKLQKSKLRDFSVFSNSRMKLIVSGVGVDAARRATQTLIDFYDITDEDIYINIGICGGDASHAIGELIEASAVVYGGQTYALPSQTPHILACSDTEVSHDSYALADMESFGFYEAVSLSKAIKRFYVFKVVSDHFKPQTVTKEGTKKLLAEALKLLEKRFLLQG